MNFLSQLHAAALSSLRTEVAELNSRLVAATRARETTEAALIRAEVQAARAEQRAEQQAARHEERLTELHSVIAELGRQLERHRATVIAEEDESGKGPLHPVSIYERHGIASRFRVPISAPRRTSERRRASEKNLRVSRPIPRRAISESLQTTTITIVIALPAARALDSSWFSPSRYREERSLRDSRRAYHHVACTVAGDDRLFR